jgi:MarR family 2-MHQ and catechol resistance regulon transcriptional repressor
LLVPDELIMPIAERFPDLFEPNATRALFALRKLAQRIDDDYNAWLAPYGLTAAKLNCLAVLYATPGHARPLGELSRFIHASNANLSVMMRALVRDGFVARKPGANDKRVVWATLRPKGVRTLERAFPFHLAQLQKSLQDVTIDERRTLTALLRKVGAGFDAALGIDALETGSERGKETG